jgi:hypothetical protein
MLLSILTILSLNRTLTLTRTIITPEFGQNYDYILYMDSDATINPYHRNRSVYDTLHIWSKDNANIYWGNKDPLQAQMLFFSNFPWRDDLPCVGTFMFKPTVLVEKILREWWDYDLPTRNRADFMEQDAMWLMLEASGATGTQPASSNYGFLVDQNNTSLMHHRQFPSEWTGLNDLWIAHIPNYWPTRILYFKYMLNTIGLLEPEKYTNAIRHVRKHACLAVDVIEVAERMENKFPITQQWSMINSTNSTIPLKIRRTNYPKEPNPPGGRADDNWHSPRNWNSPERKKLPVYGWLYNGFVLSFKDNDYWLVENATRRAFPNLETFKIMGMKEELLFKFGPKNKEINIPIGPPLPDLK